MIKIKVYRIIYVTSGKRTRHIIPHRRIRAQPPTVLRIEIPRAVVVEPRLLILLLRRKLVRPAVVRIAEIYFTRRLRGMSVQQVAQSSLYPPMLGIPFLHIFFYKKSPPTVRKPHSLYFPDYIHELTRSGYSNRFFRV